MRYRRRIYNPKTNSYYWLYPRSKGGTTSLKGRKPLSIKKPEEASSGRRIPVEVGTASERDRPNGEGENE